MLKRWIGIDSGKRFLMTIDAVPDGIKLGEIKSMVAAVQHVKQVQHVHVWLLITTENALTAQVVIDEQLLFKAKLEVKHELEHHNVHHCTIEMV